MANTYVDYTATAAQTDFAFNFNYLEDSHVVVEIDGIDKTLTTDYTIVTSPSKKVVLTSGATAGQLVRVKRVSDFGTDLVDFVNGSVLNEADLDKAYQHNRYLNEEAAEGNNDSMQTVGGGTDFNAESKKIVNLATPTLGTDATNKNYVDDRVALGSTNLNGFDKSTHTGDNTETEFTLSFTSQTTTPEAYLVTIDGVVQTPTTAYSVNTTTNKIIFTSAPPTSANIVVVPIGTTSSANDATVTQAGTSTTKTLANWTNDLQTGLIDVTATGSTVARSLATRASDIFNVKDYGATGDGSTNDTVEIQAAIDAAEATGGGTVYFPEGTYRIARTTGTNDRWGIKIDSSNVTLRGETGSKLRRYDTDISTYALAYPILFVGVADNNSGAQVTNATITDLEFVGENTRHSTSGSSIHDFRTAIEFKNTSRTVVKNCTFTVIDSRAISYQAPNDYDYVASTEYNTTKNYKSEVLNCKFLATAHSTNNRALMHTVDIGGVDEIVISANQFEWCDNAISGSGTYDDLDDVETDTYTAAVGTVKRCGKGWVISSNVVKNSSEHAFYLEGMDVTVNANTINNDNVTVCGVGDAIKIRSRNCSCTGNSISNYILGIGVHEPAFNVTISGNTIATPVGTSSGGIIDVNADTLPAYIAARPFLTTYYSVGNVSITGNTIQCPQAGTGLSQIAFRIATPTSTSSDYPDDDIISGVTIRGNTVRNHRYGVYMYGILAKSINVAGNTFDGKPFILSAGANPLSWRSGETEAPLVADVVHGTNAFQQLTFMDNRVYGSNYLFASTTGAGTASTIHIPWGCVSNSLWYIENFKTSDMRTIDHFNAFTNNTGLFFTDRTWNNGFAVGNMLGNTTDNSFRLSSFMYDVTTNQLGYYYDDLGNKRLLN